MIVQAHFLSDVVIGAGVGLATAFVLQRTGTWTERTWTRWETRAASSTAEPVGETLSDSSPADTLKVADGGNVQQPSIPTRNFQELGGENDVGSSTIDTQRRRAG